MPDIDLSDYEGREQAYVKHRLLQKYLPDLVYKISTWCDALVFVDGFAGPWLTRDPQYADSSFGVALQKLRECQDGLKAKGRDFKVRLILVEQDKDSYPRLAQFAKAKTEERCSIHALKGEFIKNIPAVNKLIEQTAHNTFRFILLDPTGWADIPMEALKTFVKGRSSEVLINLMTKDIIRFLDEDTRAKSYMKLFGREGVLEDLRKIPKEERADAAVREYCKSLKQQCEFEYVSSAVILEPKKEQIKYFLVYATNHPKGVEVFKAAENKVAKIQDAIRHEIDLGGQGELAFASTETASPFARRLHRQYSERARTKVIDALLTDQSKSELPYSRVFCEGMAFPLVTPNDLIEWLRALEPHIEIRLEGAHRKKPSPSGNDRVVVINRQQLRAAY
jgi:three-Cys-motif partner protein